MPPKERRSGDESKMRQKLPPLDTPTKENIKAAYEGDPDETAPLDDHGDESTQRAQRIARDLHEKYEKQVQRWKDYRNLFIFIAFVALFLAVLYLQRNAQVAYQVHSTLSTIIPGTLYMDSSAGVLKWIKSILKDIWKDPACGDGVCETPFEFASYGRFGCRADCGKLSEIQNLTTVLVDLYYDFDHPVTSIPAADLMTQAAWNLCPKDGAPHGKDCYYKTDQKFESLKGEVHVTIDDVPDGDWLVRVKRDFFNKIRGAVRIVEKVGEQGIWDKKYGAYLAAKADQAFELRVLQEATDMADTSAYNLTGQKFEQQFQAQYESNRLAHQAGSLNDTAYASANSTVDGERDFSFEQYRKATCRCASLGVNIDFEVGCQGTPGETLSAEVVDGVTLTEAEVCERYRNLTDATIADRLTQVREKLTTERLGSNGQGGKVGARAAKKAELKSYIQQNKPEVYDWAFTIPRGQTPEKDVNFTVTRFDVLAKYFSDGPTGYMDPSSLDAQLKLTSREVSTAELPALKQRSEDRIQEIKEQQQEVDELTEVVIMLSIYSDLGVDFNKDPLPNFIDYNYVTWSGSKTEYMVCNLESRAPKYVGTCTKRVDCQRVNDTTPFTCESGSGLVGQACDNRCTKQDDCDAICECASFTPCGSDEYCECQVCTELEDAANTEEFKSIQSIAESGGSSSAGLVGRRRARKLQQNNETDTSEQLSELLDGVTNLRAGQDDLKSQVRSLEDEVKTANALAEQRADDNTLQQLINQGRQEIAQGQERVEGMLEEIIGKQNQALEAAEEARKTVQALEELTIKASQAQAAVDKAIREQLNAIKIASQQNLITLSQALELWKRARRDRLAADRKVELANHRCSSNNVIDHEFGVDNYEEEDLQTSRERHIGLTNRVIAGMLLHTSRTKPVQCPESRFTDIENECSGDLTSHSFGVDPVFKMGTTLFNPDLDNQESMELFYNCSELNTATFNLRDPYSKYERFVNQEPFCAELFNIRNIPFGFRAFRLEGKPIGFPIWFDINLSEGEANKWYAYVEEGLYLDGDTRTVTAELVTYNAELKMFGFVRVMFTYTDGGSIKVTQKLHTLKVELYETPEDFVRLAIEVLWTGSVFLWLILDIWNMIQARVQRGSFLKFFTSPWVWTDLTSNALMAVAVIMWWILVNNYANPFDIELRYNVYESLNPPAAYLKLKDRGANLILAHNDFRKMQQLVDKLAWYYAINGINILLLIARLLKRMDFQPRLGVVTRSLALAGPDLVHFSLVSGMVFIGYAMMAHLIFGNAIQGFSTFSKSVNTCFEILLGEIGVNEELKSLSGLQALAGTLFFWSFELLVFMVLLNFLLAIIVDAFSEVKENTSDMTGMHTELAQMVRIKWQNFMGYMKNKNHVPYQHLGQMLKQWAGAEEEKEPLITTDVIQERTIKVCGEEVDSAALKEILQQCLTEAPPVDSKPSVLSRLFRVGGSSSHLMPSDVELIKTAEYVIERFGHLPGEGDEDDEDDEKDEAGDDKVEDQILQETSEQLEKEREKLANALERLAEVQRELADGQRNLMMGQRQLAQQQGRLVNLLSQEKR